MTTIAGIKRGPVGRLGGFAADHARAIFVTWAVVAIVLAAFAPRVEHALSGAGWQADGSESVAARDTIDRSFGGRSSSALTVVVKPSSPAVLRRVERIVGGEPHTTVSPDGRTAVLTFGATDDPTAMVARAGELRPQLDRIEGVSLTGSPAVWNEFR